MRIDAAAPELHAIPWELLRDAGPRFIPQNLAASSATPFSRYLAGPWRSPPPVEERPIRLLVAIPDPTDLPTYGLDPVDVVAERQTILAACRNFSKRQLAITFLASPVTLAALETELRKGYHILHIVAHGISPPHGDPAILILANSANQAALITEDELAELFVRQPGALRLAFLDACQGATRSPADAFRGFAPKLVAAGIPAVMAMQDLVPVETSRKFTGAFYGRLLQHGLVDLASNEARSTLLSEGEVQSWGIPALYSRVSDGLIIQPARPQPVFLPFLAALLVLAAALAAFGWTQEWFIRPMAAGFNVAVARFTAADAAAQQACMTGQTELGDWLYDAVTQKLETPSSVPSHMRGPAEVGAITGADREARFQAR